MTLTSIPLRWVLTLPFVVPMVGAFLLIGYLSHRNSQRAVEALGQQLLAESNARVLQALDAHLQPPLQINQWHHDRVQQGDINLQNIPELEAKLFRRLQQFEAVSAVLFVSPQGTLRLVERLPEQAAEEFFLVVSDPPRPEQLRVYRLDRQGNRTQQVATSEGLDVRRDRPWYARAVAERRLGWSPIAPYGQLRQLTLTASQPVYEAATQRLLGVFAVHIRLDPLNDFVRQLDISQVGRVLILEPDGTLVATSGSETVYQFPADAAAASAFERRTLATSSDALTQALGHHLGDRLVDLSRLAQPQQLSFRFEGQRQLVQVTPFQDDYGLEWLIVTAVPQSHFTGAVQDNTQQTLWLSLLTLGAALAIGQGANTLLTRQVARIKQASHDLALGQPTHPLPTQGLIDEFNHLAQTHNWMREQLQQTTAQIQAALQVSEEKFATVFRNSPSPMSIATLAEGRILEVNESLLAFFGYTREEVIGRTALELNFWVDLAERGHYRTLLHQQGHVSNLEVRLRTKAGAIKTALLSASVHRLEGENRLVIVHRDISERKAAELALQASEARYRAIVNALPDLIIRIHRDGTYLDIKLSDAFPTLITAADVGQNIRTMLPEATAQMYLQAIWTALDTGVMQVFESPFWLTDHWRWEEMRIVPLSGDEALLVVRDLTDRQQMEAELRQSQADLLAAQKIAHVGSWELDLTTQTLTWSAGLFDIFDRDMSQSEPSYEELLELIPPGDREALVRQIEQAVSHGTCYEVEHRILRPDGTPRYVITRGQVAYDDQQTATRLYGVALDITERKQAAMALQESEARFRALAETVQQGFFVFEVATAQYSYLNPALVAMTGIPNPAAETEPPPIAGMSHWFDRIHPEDRDRIQAALQDEREGKPFDEEYRFIKPDGTVLWLRSRAFPLRDEQGQVFRIVGTVDDMTERRQVEETLREREAMLRALGDNLPRGFIYQCVYEPGQPLGRYTYVSAGVEQLLGLKPEDVIADSAVMRTVGFADEQAAAERAVQASIKHLTPLELQMRNRTTTGEIRWSAIREKPRLLDDGRVVSDGIEVDITDLKRTEASLREREAMLRAIGDNLPKGFVYQLLYHPERGFSYSYISAGIERIVGLSPAAVMQHPDCLLDTIVAEDRQSYQQLLQQSLASCSIFEMQIRMQTTSRDMQWLSVVAVPRRTEDHCTIWDGVAVDISTFKQAEAALRDSAEFFRQVFDNAPIGVSLITPSGRFLKANASYCNLLGYTEAELLRLGFQDVTYPEDLAKDVAGMQQLLSGEIPFLRLEKRYVSRQGVPIPVLMNAAVIRDPTGQPLYIVGHVQDIRDRLKVEQMKDEFISIISHELRTPLTSIQGALDIIESGIYGDRPDKAQHMLHIAIRNSERLASLINEILNLERLDSGQVQLEQESCQVAELMQQAVEGVLAIADQAGITLSYEPLDCTLWADANAVVQVLTNLLSNAIKFSFAGGTVRLTAVQQQAACPDRAHPEHGLAMPPHQAIAAPYVLFTVQDQGRGIPAEKLETIFEPFQQVDASDSRQRGGTGLGLAICRRIVQQHHGQIWVESDVEVGSSFYMALPLDKPHE